MKRNKYILDKWADEISNYKELSITEAQELYRKYVTTEDEELKKSYLNKLILGTSYVLCDYISKNNLIMLCTPQFDMDDLINSFLEVWIKLIKKGKLLDVKIYSGLFTSSLFTDLYESLGCSEIEISQQFSITAEVFCDLFYRYAECKNCDKEFDYYDILEKNNACYVTAEVREIIPLFEKMYNRLISDKNEPLEIAKTRILSFLKYFINVGLLDRLNTRVLDESDMENSIQFSVSAEPLLQDVDSLIASDRNRALIHYIYGFEDGEHTTKEAAKRVHISRKHANAIELNTRRQLSHDPKIKKYRDLIR